MSRPSERELRAGIVRHCHASAARDFTPGTSGNISARLDERRLLITPTGRNKAAMRPGDIVVVDRAGNRLEGKLKPTSEVRMHRIFYDVRPDVEAVVHAHPPTATGFACAGIALDQPLASEFIAALGCAPLAPYGTPGTEELSEPLRGIAKDNDAVLLANHGVVTCGRSLDEASDKMELVEHYAKILLVVRMLKQERRLKESDILKLLQARAAYFGLESVPERNPCCPTPGQLDPEGEKPAGADPAALERAIEEVLKRYRH